jgi:hypothetical protein
MGKVSMRRGEPKDGCGYELINRSDAVIPLVRPQEYE